MLASDLMTPRVVATTPDASVQAVARLMLENGIGAAPVLDVAGAVVGMVSDGDLLGRRPDEYRRDWWLEMLADAALPRAGASAGLLRPVREVMSAPVVSIGPQTSAAEIAALMQAHRIKRLPVIQDGALVGIVSRTDLLGVVEQFRRLAPGEGEAGKGLLKFLESLVGGASLLGAGAPSAAAAAPAAPPDSPPLSAEAFRDQVRAFEQEAVERAAAEKEALRLERRRQAELVLREHVSEPLWRKLIDHAEVAARHGEKEFLLDRFPCDLCSDGGRMIDVAEEGWEATLRGKPAELFARWRAELRPRGFGLSARIVSYVDGVLGDVGLYLTWGA